MADMSKFSPDNGLTILNIKDAVARSSVAAQNVLLKDTVGWVVKNYLKLINAITSTVSYMVTDGALSVFGTSGSSSSNYTIYFDLPDGDYIFYTGYIPSNTATTLNIFKVSQGSVISGGEIAVINSASENNYIPFTVDHDGYDSLQFRIWNRKETTYNYTCYPMVCKAEVFNGTFEPYHESADEYLASKGLLKGTVGWIGKNLLKYPYTDTTKTDHQVTFTDNGDGSITINGTASGGNAYFTFFGTSGSTEKIIPPGKYKITSNGLGDNIQIMPVYKTIGYSNLDNVDAVDGLSYMCVRVPSGKTVNNVTIHPMIREASITDDTYEPYHKTVEEMFDDLGTASVKNAISVVTDSSDLVESGSVKDIVGWGNKNLLDPQYYSLGMYTDVNFNQDTSTVYCSARAYVKAGTYTISFAKNVRIVRVIKNGVYSQDGATNVNKYTVETTIDGWIGFSWRDEISSSTNWDITSPVQIEKGSKATSYEPYHASVAEYCASKQLLENTVGWIGKNIGVWYNVALSGDTTVGYKLNANGSSLIAPIKNNTNYTVSKKSTSYGNRFRIILFKNEPSFTTSLEVLVIINNSASLTEYTFNSGVYNYVVFTYESSDVITQDTAEAMIELGSVKTAYEPYHVSVENYCASKELLKDTVGWVGKNLLPNNAVSQTVNGVTFTVNADGSVTVNGTASSNATFVINSFNKVSDIFNDNLILSGCPSGGSASTYELALNYKDSESASSYQYIHEFGNGESISLAGKWIAGVYIMVRSGVTISNKVFNPMISKNGGAYEPYHESVEQTLRDAEVVQGKNLLNSRNATLYNAQIVDYTDNEMSNIQADSKTALSFIVDLFNGSSYVEHLVSQTVISNTGVHEFSFTAKSTGTVIKFGHNGSSKDVKITYAYQGGFSAGNDYIISFNLISNHPDNVGGLVIDNIMIRKADITDSTYEPYYTPLKDVVPNKCDKSVIAPTENGTTASKSYSAGRGFIHNGEFRVVKTNGIASGETIDNNNSEAKTIEEQLAKNIEITVTGATSNYTLVQKLLERILNSEFAVNTKYSGCLYASGLDVMMYSAIKLSATFARCEIVRTNNIILGQVNNGTYAVNECPTANIPKSDTFSGKTNVSGNILISNDTARTIVAVKINEGYVALPYYTSSYAGAHICEPANLSPKTETAVSGTYYYI